ncbi:hypothetical protein DCAR_0729910 [Daucus carota subsp. sativus]|uniref:Uncharacterized protein n=1 Tax=Daucus carota subsp. sativus TaxID=79200 RepID=A0A164UJN6_DAUCS|nr:hypothetical protein DCAR_0729910 [Daucus carota subsp. sativus]
MATTMTCRISRSLNIKFQMRNIKRVRPHIKSQIELLPMDSTKTNLLEKEASAEFPKTNTGKLCILSLVILLSLVIAGVLFITTVINLRDTPNPNVDMIQFIDLTPVLVPTPVQSIRAVCSFVIYKRLCHNTLASSISTNISGDNPPPEDIIFRFFQLAVNQLIRLADVSKDDYKLEECQLLLNKELNVLNNSIATSQNLDAFRHEVNEYLDRFKRMKANQQSCLDKLQESGSTAIQVVGSNVRIMRRVMSNSRAVLLNIDPIINKMYGSFPSSVQIIDHNPIRSTSDDNLESQPSPLNMIFYSFQVSVIQLTHLASFHNISKPNDVAEPVLLECQVLFNKDLAGLNNSVSSSRNFYYFTKIERDEYVEVFNKTETNQQSCLDRLEESTNGSTVIDEIRFNVEKTRRYMSNTRAILVKFEPILDSIYGNFPSADTADYYSFYFDGLSYEYMVIFVPQYVFLILLFILMLKQY